MIGEEEVARALTLPSDDPDRWKWNLVSARRAIPAFVAALLDPRNRTMEMVEAGIASLGADDDRATAMLVCDIFDAMLRAVAAPPAQNGDER